MTNANQPSLSVIIPIWNEERTVGSIVEIIRTWGKASEIVVVDDGSTDKSLAALAHFRNSIRVITYGKNRGKGYAMYRGVVASTGEAIMFFDGDVVGVTHKDLDAMLAPIRAGRADMVLGVARFWSAGSFEPFNDITGQRIVYRKHIIDDIEKIKHIGYGVELYLNELHKHKRVVSIRLPHVFILGKLEKQKIPDAMVSTIVETKELITQFIMGQAKDLPPPTKRFLRTVQMYLMNALEFFK